MTNPPLIQFEDVTTVFRGKRSGNDVVAVDQVTFSMPSDRPSILTIVGESGSGKTTLSRNLLGLTRHTSGTIRYRGQDLQTLQGAEKRDFRLKRVVEYGDMDRIIADPQHPYTQTLIQSVPNPDPGQRQQITDGAAAMIDTNALAVRDNACVFAERCPHVMDVCRAQRPQMIAVHDDQRSACFLQSPE